MRQRFLGKVVLITGAGSGIGEATALAFGREGARVAVNDHRVSGAESTAARIRAEGGEAAVVVGDVAWAEDCNRIVAETLARFQALDILVNNAGVGTTGTVLSTDEATFDRLMAVNLKGTFLMSKAALQTMVPKKAGVILNAASVAGLAGLPDRAAYVATKFGVVGLTKAMALDHVKDGIRVNCLCPGTTSTPWIEKRLAEADDKEAALAALVARQPMGRLGRADEMAAAYLFLASDESAFTTGTALVVDGGLLA